MRGGFGGPGGDLLFRALRRSTIGAEGFHGRVRNGIGCFAPRYGHQAVQAFVRPRKRSARPGRTKPPDLIRGPGAACSVLLRHGVRGSRVREASCEVTRRSWLVALSAGPRLSPGRRSPNALLRKSGLSTFLAG